MKKLVIASLLAAFAATQAQAATIAYMTIKGAKQGMFKGDVAAGVHKDTIGISAFSYEVTSPRDAASGLPSGKRQHQPLVITKLWGAASPQILTAIATNEVLTQVSIDFYSTGVEGKETLQFSYDLTNAQVADVTETFGTTPGETAPQNLQQFSLTFQKITIKDAVSGTTYADDWTAAQ